MNIPPLNNEAPASSHAANYFFPTRMSGSTQGRTSGGLGEALAGQEEEWKGLTQPPPDHRGDPCATVGSGGGLRMQSQDALHMGRTSGHSSVQ